MNDLAFFVPVSSVDLSVLSGLAAYGDVALPAPDHAQRLFRGIAALDRAGPDEVTVFLDGDHPADLAATRAGACFIARDHAGKVPPTTIALVTERPHDVLRQAVALFYPDAAATGPLFERRGIDPAATVHRDARLEHDVTVDPGAVVGPRVEIGMGTTIGANAVIGAGVRIGRGCVVDAQASVQAALIGDRVSIHAGARIGLGSRRAPSLGRVIVQDDVEIGANAVIERGRLGDTMIGEGARIGALTMIAADMLVDRRGGQMAADG